MPGGGRRQGREEHSRTWANACGTEGDQCGQITRATWTMGSSANSVQLLTASMTLGELFFFFGLGLRCCAQAFSSCSERGLLFVVVCGLLIVVAPLVAEHGLQ